jgi:predicted glycosyltransferase
MKILLYCQYVWGMGHLFRSLELVRALSGHRVVLVAGGQEVPIRLPAHAALVRLPALFMDEFFTTLQSGEPGRSVAAVKQERCERLLQLMDEERPDAFVVELYPFGRTAFGFEIDPLLEAIQAGRFGRVLRVCSIRDVLVEKRDPTAYEARVVERLNRHFDRLLIHSDERLLPLEATFSRVGDVRIPIAYTGFVAPTPETDAARRLRQALGVGPGETLVVASAGGGRAGFRLLKEVLAACRELSARRPLRLELFTGPFMADEEFDQLHRLAAPRLRVRRFTARFLRYLQAADLSISLAGYNTCMNLLVARVPALVLPYSRQREQPLRIEKIKPYLAMEVLAEEDLTAVRLAAAAERALARKPQPKPLPLDLAGAATTARLLASWVRERTGETPP